MTFYFNKYAAAGIDDLPIAALPPAGAPDPLNQRHPILGDAFWARHGKRKQEMLAASKQGRKWTQAGSAVPAAKLDSKTEADLARRRPSRWQRPEHRISVSGFDPVTMSNIERIQSPGMKADVRTNARRRTTLYWLLSLVLAEY